VEYQRTAAEKIKQWDKAAEEDDVQEIKING
jgi:hypothetical protein